MISDHDTFVKKANAQALAALAIKYGLPSIGAEQLCRSGALAAYGVYFSDQFRRAAFFVEKILRGNKPGDLPFERATRFQYIVNSTTAKALGITVPPLLLARADEVIE